MNYIRNVLAVWGWSLGLVCAAPSQRPNILWITSEDNGPHLGCYGDSYASTPHLDALAAKGMIYRHVWSVAPVCAPARTAIISGVYPSSTGAEHMRSQVTMPSFMKMYPQFLRDAGYYCSNNSKEDYNLEKPGRVWDDSSAKAHWKQRRPGQPFFAIFNHTVTHESQVRKRPHTPVHDPARVRVPAYHPDTPEVRQDWAQYHDKISEMDAAAGRNLRELEAAGLAEDTIVFYYGDHGPGLPRCKRWPYNSGLQVPLIVYLPPQFRHLAPSDYRPGGKSERLVSFVDLAPTLLSLAGIKPPAWMQGHAFMGEYPAPPPSYLHGLRGRMDERYDLVRSVRDARYVYIRNYMPHKIYGQHVGYMFETPTTRVWKALYDEGKLRPPQTRFWEPKPAEELYDLQSDPDEVTNLAASPQHQEILKRLRAEQQQQARRVRDVGFLPEGEIHSRAQGATPYEVGHDDRRYPFERVLAAADVASTSTASPSELKPLFRDSDSAVRYWAALGIQMRGKPGVESCRPELVQALQDDSPYVQALAAHSLAQFGDEAEARAALAVLGRLAPPATNGVFASMLSLIAIDELGGKARSLVPVVREMSTRDANAPPRTGEYVGRLAAKILR